MNDNTAKWRSAEFEISMGVGGLGGARVVRGSICGVFAVHDDEANDIPYQDVYRISITHLPSGESIGRAKNGAAAYEIVEQLMLMADDFARALKGRDLSHVANKIADIFDARDGYTNARLYA